MWVIIKGDRLKGSALQRWLQYPWHAFLNVEEVYRLRISHRTSIYAVRLEGDEKDIQICLREIQRYARILLKADNIELSDGWERLPSA